MSEHNPYQQPQAVLTTGEAEFPAIRAAAVRPFGHGALWLSQAWEIFAKNWGLWLGGVLVIYAISMAIGFFPLIGMLAGPILNPVLYAGIYNVARKLENNQPVEFGEFLSGFQHRTGTLIGFGAISLLLAILLMLVVALVGWAILGADMSTLMSAADADVMPSMNMLMLEKTMLVLLIGAALLFPFLAMTWFAVPLLVLDDSMTIGRALALSFSGCMKSFLPMTLYGVLMLVLLVVALIPFMLGLLVFLPLIAISVYTSFKDIYLSNSSATAGS